MYTEDLEALGWDLVGLEYEGPGVYECTAVKQGVESYEEALKYGEILKVQGYTKIGALSALVMEVRDQEEIRSRLLA